MGDNTWLSVFPDSFQSNMSFPYDSFNVEDLHTVDEGVTEHLFPLLQDSTNPWDFLIGHFLGVDHVGHRMGPDHPVMKAKLEQMNDVLTPTIELLHEDTLLVLIGDHGMDRTGDHGGDGELEVSSGVWIYSKGPPLSTPSIVSAIPSEILPEITFSGTSAPHRAIQQIDLVPTLSLLLGLPIPYNNLGSIIPELFARKNTLSRALQLNTDQIHQYLNTYRASSYGGELDGVWPTLQHLWATTMGTIPTQAQLIALNDYNRFALLSCRSLWAQFNVVLMIMGLVLLGVGVLACWALYSHLGEEKGGWDAWLGDILPRSLRGMVGGAIVGMFSHFSLGSHLEGVGCLHFVIFGAILVSSLVFITSACPTLYPSVTAIKAIPLPLILHTMSFFSNSFTVWEDRIILFLLISAVLPSVLTGIVAPTPRLRYRIIGFSVLFVLCVRLMAMSTVCREEQQPFCHVTFYASSSLPIPPLLILIVALPTSLALPYLIRTFLGISKSDNGVVTMFLCSFGLTLLSSSAHWLLEWADLTGVLGSEWTGRVTLRSIRSGFAFFAVGSMLLSGIILWWVGLLCLGISVDQRGANGNLSKQVTILGFANALGAPYLIFWCICFGVVYATSMLTSQVVLCLAAIALLAYLEMVDSVRDVQGIDVALTSSTPSTILHFNAMQSSSTPLTFSEIIPLALLGMHMFYGTGHQSTIPSIQWKAGFVLTPTVVYPFSPMTVFINTFGPQFLVAFASPLLALWNVPPLPLPLSPIVAQGQSIRAALGVSLYYATLLFGSALSAGVLRRHLMVWKIFAPRFMVAAASLLSVDFALFVGIVFGVRRVRESVEIVFKGVGDRGSDRRTVTDNGQAPT